MYPKYVKFEKVQITVQTLMPSTFNEWTDSTKWICTTARFNCQLGPQMGMVVGPADALNDFIKQYPYPVGTFYVVCEFSEFCTIVSDNPNRDLRYLIVN
jgi:hypothetical protein